MTRGPEERNIIGSITEEQAQIFFEKFCKWKLILKNEDFSNTKFGKDKSGFDQLYEINDPILDKKIYVLVESKFREKSTSLRSPELFDFIYHLKKKVLKGQNPVTWKNTIKERINDIQYGILFLRFQNYSDEQLRKTLGSIAISKTKRETIPPTIFTLFNHRLAKFAEFAQNDDITYSYPAGVGGRTFDKESKVLSLFYLFSDLVSGTYTDNQTKKEKKFIITFEKPNLESMKYLCIYISRVIKPKSAGNCIVYFTEGNFNDIERYRTDYLSKDYKELQISILNGLENDCNFDFKGKFK